MARDLTFDAVEDALKAVMMYDIPWWSGSLEPRTDRAAAEFVVKADEYGQWRLEWVVNGVSFGSRPIFT